MKIDVEASNVIYKTMTVSEIREGDSDTIGEDMYALLDEAQGEVFTGSKQRMYVIVEVSDG